MKDPSSTQFQDVRKCLHDGSVIQGEVNAKNGFGAYSGFEAFFHSEQASVLASEVEVEEWLDWLERCYGPEAVAESRKEAREFEARLEQ